MKIEERVLSALETGLKGDFVQALAHITPAIEASARKKLGKSKISREEYKAFLRGYHFVIERFIGEGFDLDRSRFPKVTLKSEGGKEIADPDFADIIYHAFRCALAHGHEIDEEFAFIRSARLGASRWLIGFEDGRVHMPDKVIWALVGVVVFCDANTEIETETGMWLEWGTEDRRGGEPYRFDIDLFWGGEATVRNFFAKRPAVRVAFDPKD